jgi:pantoate--beta-alanine ligase
MKLVTSLSELHAAKHQLHEPVGLVPTMGYLHEGHLSLVQAAIQDCASVIVSVFINPSQFGPGEDLSSYPLSLSRDIEMLHGVGADLLWTPTANELYPEGYQTWVSVEEVTKPLEGAMRPGHFRGVATIVAKLFNAVQPQRAYFGQKDAQQVVTIRKLVRDLNYPIDLVVCPIIREPDGLAMSSRNTYLSPAERQAATVLYRALSSAKDAFTGAEHNASELRARMQEIIASETLARAQYISCADPDTLRELQSDVSYALLSLAVFIRKTRLIDNMIIGMKE